MDINDVTSKEEFLEIVINELKSYGIKHLKEKKKNIMQKKPFRKNIFRTHLPLLDLTDVILVNGRVVQIPKFVAEACNRILEHVETEGIFRKAGSFIRQKEIRISLETGDTLGKSHHVVDIANVVKYFFRELPEPLIPPAIQETFLRCLLVGENYNKTIILACLLLPPLHINTLSFFMQFLYTVSLSEHLNKMSVENLAIIFTPGLMPFPNINSHRFTNHVKIVRILIENANVIGTIPSSIEIKLQRNLIMIDSETNSTDVPLPDVVKNVVMENGAKVSSAKKKKKRRSGSLTHMFYGFRKIVGSAMGSSEYLDYPQTAETENGTTTPSIKENKKRKFGEPSSAFSAKKKEPKKSRLSLGGGRHIKNISLNPVVNSMERRWSIVGSGWSKTKNKHFTEHNNYKCNEHIIDVDHTEKKTKNLNVSKLDFKFESATQVIGNNLNIEKPRDDSGNVSNCLKISKNEYEEIKERVAAIESRISNEFESVHHNVLPISVQVSAAEHVQTQYERVVVKTEALLSPGTDQLAQRLSRGLNIRRSTDHRVIRSPSARKIGTIRQRSQEKIRRDSSWHIRSSNTDQYYKEVLPLIEANKYSSNAANPVCFYNKNVQTSSLQMSVQHNQKIKMHNASCNDFSNEQWMSGETFFDNTQRKQQTYIENENSFISINFDHVTTPKSHRNDFDTEKTPMLPPKSLPRRIYNAKTPLNINMKPATTSKLALVNRIAASTPAVEEVSGRASIARLRAQNAGMVMAKAKLFDGLETNISKERCSLKSKKQNLLSSTNMKCCTKPLIQQNDTTALRSKSTVSSTAISKRIQSTNVNSPAGSSKRKPRCKISQNQQFINSIVVDNKLTTRYHLSEHSQGASLITKTDMTKPNICRTNSPRNTKKKRQHIKTRNNSSGILQRHNI